MNVGGYIRTCRERAGLSLTELARRAEISKSYLHGIEHANTENPSFDVVMRIAWVLEVDPRGWWQPPDGNEVTSQTMQDRRMYERIGRDLAVRALETALAALRERDA
jgi:transcriptional regulator with XRE-family HTH domain